MLNSTKLYTALNKTPLTALLSTYGTGKALFNDELIPANCTGRKTVNFYRSRIYDPNNAFDLCVYIANCRAQTSAESLAIAEAVITQINRVYADKTFYICSMLQTIPPQDDRDNYCTPVEITIKMRG